MFTPSILALAASAALVSALPPKGQTLSYSYHDGAVPHPIHNSRWPDPEPCDGSCTGVHDPNIIKRDGVFYRFSTSGNIKIATSTSLNGPWSYIGAVLDNGTSIWVCEGQDVWAPDVSKIGDTYYAFYAVSRLGFGGSDIGMATSPSLEPGSWTDHGTLGLPQSESYNLIDPNLFIEANKLYLTFGSFWMDIFQTTLPDPPIKYSSSPIEELLNNNSDSAAVWEAPFQFKWNHRGRHLYYLFYSAGECCKQPPDLAEKGDEYRIQVCRGESVRGPYFDHQGCDCKTEDGGTLVLGSHDDVYAPGGQGVMFDPVIGRPVIYYHYVKPSVGYKEDQFYFGWNYLDFSSGWPVVVKEHAFPKGHNGPGGNHRPNGRGNGNGARF